jgi:DNA polymerase III epsilon subunit-like protein
MNEAARRLWAKARLVVLDTETTGIGPRDRIVSIGAFVVENGVTVASWSTVVNPGLAVIGATSFHGLHAERLAGASAFAAHTEKLTELLRHDTKTTYLVGHNIGFDAGRIAYEFLLLGHPHPPMLLLDNQRLAPAAGIGTANATQDELAALFGLSNPARHEAASDALIAREIALRSIDALTGQDVSDLDTFAVTFVRGVGNASSSRTVALTPEHEAVHALAMTTRAVREEALGQCLSWACPLLHHRVEDAIKDASSARRLVDWCSAQLRVSGLTRQQQGLLADGAVRALRAGVTPSRSQTRRSCSQRLSACCPRR